MSNSRHEVDSYINQETPSSYKNPDPSPMIMVAHVIDVADTNDARRIKARIKGLDDNIGTESLPYCSPFLPLMFNINPKKGEAVFVIIPDKNRPNSNRLWLGPIISQYQNIDKDPFNNSATNAMSMGTEQLKAGFTQREDTKDLYPDRDTISLVGRRNADIRIGSDFAEMIVGKRNGKIYNSVNPATCSSYIIPENEDSFETVNSMQSNYNFLISHTTAPQLSPKIRELDFEKVIDETSPMVMGDVLVEILNKFRQAFLSHVHGENPLAPDKSNPVRILENLDFEDMLSENNRLK